MPIVPKPPRRPATPADRARGVALALAGGVLVAAFFLPWLELRQFDRSLARATGLGICFGVASPAGEQADIPDDEFSDALAARPSQFTSPATALGLVIVGLLGALGACRARATAWSAWLLGLLGLGAALPAVAEGTAAVAVLPALWLTVVLHVSLVAWSSFGLGRVGQASDTADAVTERRRRSRKLGRACACATLPACVLLAVLFFAPWAHAPRGPSPRVGLSGWGMIVKEVSPVFGPGPETAKAVAAERMEAYAPASIALLLPAAMVLLSVLGMSGRLGAGLVAAGLTVLAAGEGASVMLCLGQSEAMLWQTGVAGGRAFGPSVAMMAGLLALVFLAAAATLVAQALWALAPKDDPAPVPQA